MHESRSRKMRGGRGRRGSPTSDGDVGETMSAADVDGVGEHPIERLGDHGQVCGVLHELQSQGAEAQPVGQMEVQSQPWEASETLHPVTEPAQSPHPLLALLPMAAEDRAAAAPIPILFPPLRRRRPEDGSAESRRPAKLALVPVGGGGGAAEADAGAGRQRPDQGRRRSSPEMQRRRPGGGNHESLGGKRGGSGAAAKQRLEHAWRDGLFLGDDYSFPESS